eukprot:24309-Eustigmatos_ZCMA.PRE.1
MSPRLPCRGRSVLLVVFMVLFIPKSGTTKGGDRDMHCRSSHKPISASLRVLIHIPYRLA